MAESKESRKIIAHSGIYFKLKKPGTGSRHEQVDTSSSLTKKNGSQRSSEMEETVTSLNDLKISKRVDMERCDQCQGICKCIEILHTVCPPQQPKKSKLPKAGKDGKELRYISPVKSIKTRQTVNSDGKEEQAVSTRQPVCPEKLKSQNRRLSRLRPPSTYKSKSKSVPEIQNAKVESQSVALSTPQPASVSITTQSECISDNLKTSLSAKASDYEPSSLSEPTSSDADKHTSATEPSSSSEPTFSDAHKHVYVTKSLSPLELTFSEADKHVSVTEPSRSSKPTFSDADKHVSLFQSSSSLQPTFSDTDNASVSEPSSSSEPTLSVVAKLVSPSVESSVESQSLSRPAFWPPSVPTYEIISVPTNYPDSPVKWRPKRGETPELLIATSSNSSESQSSKKAKVPQKCVVSSRTTRIPKILPNAAKDTKSSGKQEQMAESEESRKIIAHSGIYFNLKKPGTGSRHEQKQTKGNEKKIEVSKKKSCK